MQRKTMAYISELLNNRITDSADQVVGRLNDVLIKKDNQVFPPLEFIVVQTPTATKYVAYELVSNFNNKVISLKNKFEKVALDALPGDAHSYVFLKKDVLDRQIVDVAGTRVVRVNDLRIGNFQDKICVLGIDAGLVSLLRRIGLGELGLSRFFPPKLIDWRQAEFLDTTQGGLQLNTAVENLSHLHPADLANVVEELGIKQASQLLTSLDATEAAKVLEEVDPELQTILVQHLGPDRAAKILSQMSSDEFTDLVKTFSEPEAQSFLAKVSGGVAQRVKKLISYEDNTAGGLMTVDFFTARPEWTVEQTIEELRKISHQMRSLVYIYVVDESGRFKGVVSMRRLLLADKATTMAKMAKHIPAHGTLRPDDKLKKVIKIMTKYNLYTAAVIDKDKKLAGVVTIDDVMRLLDPDA